MLSLSVARDHAGRVERLRWPAANASIAYQSRLGQDRWLEPHTDKELHASRAAGVRRLAVMCPSFTVDCLETLEEIAERGRKSFLDAGGLEFTMIPALNDSARLDRSHGREYRAAYELVGDVAQA